MITTIHTFEAAGLGKAPFTFSGDVTEGTQSHCDYCSTSIKYEFWVTSNDSRRFKVGCECIRKTGDRGLIRQIEAAEKKIRDAKNKAAKEKKMAKLAQKVEAAKAKLPLVRGKLSEQPHPDRYFANQGKTCLDYVRWCLENGQGERAAIYIERA